MEVERPTHSIKTGNKIETKKIKRMCCATPNDENISNHGYIGTSILKIHRKYRRNVGGYFFTNISGMKIIQNS